MLFRFAAVLLAGFVAFAVVFRAGAFAEALAVGFLAVALAAVLPADFGAALAAVLRVVAIFMLLRHCLKRRIAACFAILCFKHKKSGRTTKLPDAPSCIKLT